MKKKVLIAGVAIITIVIVIAVILINFKPKNEDIQNKYLKLLSKYDEIENLNNQKFQNTYETSYSLDSMTNVRGNISTIAYLNNDKYEGINFYFLEDKITMSLLELDIEKNEVRKVDEKTLLNEIPKLDKFNISLFSIQLNNKPYFFLEINGSASILANGFIYELRSVTIENDKIVLMDTSTLEGSAPLEEEIDEYIDKIKQMGLSVNTINQTVFSQNENAVKIFEINRTHLKEFIKQENQHTVYGETIFIDLLNNSHLLKFENEETKKDNENNEYEFKPSNIGRYTYEDENKGDYISFEIQKQDDGYYYILEAFYNNANKAAEELWGDWDVTKTELIPENKNDISLAEYKFKNIKYSETDISFDVETINVKTENFIEYVIPNKNYNFHKVEDYSEQ